jgi:hypothetical protein
MLSGGVRRGGWAGMHDQPMQGENEILHQLKNHLSIIVGFCDLLLEELPSADPRHADILEVDKAARAAMALMPELAKRLP